MDHPRCGFAARPQGGAAGGPAKPDPRHPLDGARFRALPALLALVRKDLRLFFSNRRALLMSIAAPILIAAFFGYLFGERAGPNAAIALAVTDLDRSEASTKVVAALRSDAAFALQALGEAEALAQVRAGKLTAALVLPEGFGAQAGRALFDVSSRPQVLMHYDPSQKMALQVVRGLLAQHTMTQVGGALLTGNGPLLGEIRSGVERNTAMPADQRGELLTMFESVERVQGRAARVPQGAASGTAATLGLPYTLKEQQAGSRPDAAYNSFAHSFAGMSVQFILLAGIEFGIGLLTMRRMDLWKRLRAAPVGKRLLLGSRLLGSALIALVLLAIIYAVAIAFFGVRIEGSIAGFACVAMAFALLTASFGLLIASIGRTPEATRGLAIFVTLLLVMLGGAWVPAFVFPQWLQTVSLFVPTRWAIDGLDAMTWRGLGFDAALAPIGLMLAFTATFAAIALWRFDWEE
jgi:ABC-2 type transport system permease protein